MSKSKKKFLEKLNSKYSILNNSGTISIYTGLLVIGLKLGDNLTISLINYLTEFFSRCDSSS